MIIRGASLVDRYYRSDGWTREDVAKLIIGVPDASISRIYYVIPRYFDSDRDIAMQKSVPHGYILHNNFGYDDCDYFAIYDSQVEVDMSEHNYQPFKMLLNYAMRKQHTLEEMLSIQPKEEDQ